MLQSIAIGKIGHFCVSYFSQKKSLTNSSAVLSSLQKATKKGPSAILPKDPENIIIPYETIRQTFL